MNSVGVLYQKLQQRCQNWNSNPRISTRAHSIILLHKHGHQFEHILSNIDNEYFFFQCHRMSLMDFSWFFPSRLWPSVTDVWGWDAYKVRLRYPDEVYGDIWIWSTRRDLKLKLYYTTQTMVTISALPIQEKSPWQNRESNPGPHDQ